VTTAADIAALVVLVAFAIMVTLITVSVATRLGRYQLRKEKAPVLLFRDATCFSGLTASFLFVLVARALELPATYTRTVPWIVGTSLPALLGLAVFLYFEWFIIGKDGDGGPT
jgi:hypothetical protein